MSLYEGIESLESIDFLFAFSCIASLTSFDTVSATADLYVARAFCVTPTSVDVATIELFNPIAPAIIAPEDVTTLIATGI